MRVQREAIPFYLATITYAIFIFYLSSLSHQTTGDGGLESPISDKFYHLSEYFVLGILLFCSIYLSKLNYSRLKKLHKTREISDSLLTLIIGGLYGITDELHQFFVPGRKSDPFDAIFDGIGVLIGVIIMIIILRWSRKVAAGEQVKNDNLDGELAKSDNLDGELAKSDKLNGELAKSDNLDGELAKSDKLNGELAKSDKMDGELAKSGKLNGESTQNYESTVELEDQNRENHATSGE